MTLIDVNSGECSELVPWSSHNISFPFCSDNRVFFNASISGIDNIYSVGIQDKLVNQVTSRPLGAYYPGISTDDKFMVFSDATANGFMVCSSQLNEIGFTPVEDIINNRVNMFISEKDIFKPENVLDDIPENNFTSRPYSQVFNAFNFHSWGLYGDGYDKNISLYLKSANVLNTFAATLNTTYNQNEKTYSYGADISYGGLFPILDAGINTGQRTALVDESFVGDETEFQTWNETSVRFGSRLPLNLSRGIYNTSLQAGFNSSLTRISGLKYIDDPEINNNGDFFPVSTYINFSRGTAWLRDVAPVWGQYFSVNYRFTPFGGDYTGRFASANGRLYFPGLIKHHSLQLNISYEWQEFDNYVYSSMVLFPRGYKSITFPEFFKAGLNYTYPLFCPEFSLLGILYSKRIVNTVFYDYGNGYYRTKGYHYRSTGMEFLSETYLFRIAFPVYLGARFSLLFNPKPGEPDHVAEFILSTGF